MARTYDVIDADDHISTIPSSPLPATQAIASSPLCGAGRAPGRMRAGSPAPPEGRIMLASVTQGRLQVSVRVKGAVSEVRLSRNLALVATEPGAPTASSDYALALDGFQARTRSARLW